MSISTVVTRGYGTFGNVNKLPVWGYGAGAPAPTPSPTPAPTPAPTPEPTAASGGGAAWIGAAGKGHYAAYPVGDSRVHEAPEPTKTPEVVREPDRLTPFMEEMARLDAIREELALRKKNEGLQRKLDALMDDEEFMALILSRPFN